MSTDLFNSLCVPTINKRLWEKSANTYGGTKAFENVQRGVAIPHDKVLIPNKFAYGLELNEGGCFRRGFNSVINGNYSPTVPINLQQSVQTSADIYFDVAGGIDGTGNGLQSASVNVNKTLLSNVSYGHFLDSGAVASVHCLCDYIFWFNFDQFGNMVDFGVSEYNDRQ